MRSSGHSGVSVTGRSITIQGQQVSFFCCLRETMLGMHDIAPASLLTYGACCFLTLGNAEAIPTFGECDFMNFYLARSFPDDKIWHIRMRSSLTVSKSKPFGLASVLLYGGVAIEKQGQLPFLKGFALDGFISFAA